MGNCVKIGVVLKLCSSLFDISQIKGARFPFSSLLHRLCSWIRIGRREVCSGDGGGPQCGDDRRVVEELLAGGRTRRGALAAAPGSSRRGERRPRQDLGGAQLGDRPPSPVGAVPRLAGACDLAPPLLKCASSPSPSPQIIDHKCTSKLQ